MKLSKRLEAIASFIPPFGGIIDVGCNHAYICIFCALKGCHKKIIGSDCNENSLVLAKQEINNYNLTDKIKLIVTDGLNGIEINKDDTIVISGLGTKTIKNILSKTVISKVDHIIIQSNNYLYELRKFMSDNNFIIKDEVVVKDRNKIYVIIDFSSSLEKVSYTEFELKYGPFASKNQKYLDYQLKKLNYQLKQVESFDKSKKELLLNEIDIIKKQF